MLGISTWTIDICLPNPHLEFLLKTAENSDFSKCYTLLKFLDLLDEYEHNQHIP